MAYYEQQLLPQLPGWRRDIAKRYGDKSTCAKKFLTELIPFFIEVVVQDGIYFVRDFPEHAFSRFLVVRTCRTDYATCTYNTVLYLLTHFILFFYWYSTGENSWVRGLGRYYARASSRN